MRVGQQNSYGCVGDKAHVNLLGGVYSFWCVVARGVYICTAAGVVVVVCTVMSSPSILLCSQLSGVEGFVFPQSASASARRRGERRQESVSQLESAARPLTTRLEGRLCKFYKRKERKIIDLLSLLKFLRHAPLAVSDPN